MAGDWRTLVAGDEFTDVMKLVHLAYRMTIVEEESMRSTLLKSRKRAYEQELSALAASLGCKRQGRLTGGPALQALNQSSKDDARSMTRTYNWDLAVAILAIKRENPRSNRNTYARRLNTWDANRSLWKSKQASMWAVLDATSAAQAAFLDLNTNVTGTAKLVGPNPAAEPLCQGWLNRGDVPAKVARANPSPFHPNCPHPWQYTLKRISSIGTQANFCAGLWMGE